MSRLVRAAGRLRARGIPVVLGTQYDVTGERLQPYPLSTLSQGLALIHKDGAGLGGDKVSRRALLTLDGHEAFPVVLAREAGLIPSRFSSQLKPKGSFGVDEIRARYFHFRYRGDPEQAYPRVPLRVLLEGGLKPSEITGRILLIGTALHEQPSDFVATPYSKEAWASPKLAIHATILDSLIANDGIIRPMGRDQHFWRILLTLLCTVGVVMLVMNTSPLAGVLGTLAGTAALVVLLALVLPGVWLPTAHPLLGILLGYYLSVPYRLLREHRKRSSLERRNEVLMQVEELKTNFLSLVTHDLKTPVARIQGLAEVLARKAADRLVERDLRTIQHIIESTDELNRFISTIMELAKLESTELKPRLESRDLNRLVEAAIEGFKAPARARRCRIEANLEPLFPIRLDPSLIQKVIHNLIDNALKYSPEGSSIEIATREVGNRVELSITDSGVGLSPEEQQNLFQKFYRAKNSATSQVPGSGLGLYLCRYFVEAHAGTIAVDSSPGRGSTFTITLPIDPPEFQALRPGLRTEAPVNLNSAQGGTP